MISFHGWRLAAPAWLLLIAAAALALWFAERRSRRGALRYSSVDLLLGAPVTGAQRLLRALPWLRFTALTLVAVGLARPQQGLEEFRVRSEGIAIVMAIDKSGSMQALDFELDGKREDRLTVVKRVFREFVEGKSGRVALRGRVDDRIGLVAFGGFAEDRCPLTLDHGALLAILDTVQIAQPIVDARGREVAAELTQEEQMTAIGDGLALACERLKDAPEKSKVVILLSDGANDAGIEPLDAAKAAATLGIRIYTIGVGSNRPVPFPRVDPFGNRFLQQVVMKMDEATLQAIAKETGGRYFAADSTDALETVYGEIDQLEKTKSEGVLYTDYRELYRFLVLPALVLLVGEALLRATRLRSLP